MVEKKKSLHNKNIVMSKKVLLISYTYPRKMKNIIIFHNFNKIFKKKLYFRLKLLLYPLSLKIPMMDMRFL